MASRFRSFLVFFSFLLCSATTFAQTTYDWTGAVSTDWSNPANWESTTNSVTTNPAATCPGSADVAQIGVLPMTNTSNFPVISTGGATSVGSIVWGTENYLDVYLTVNTTFAVNGSINNTSAVPGNGASSAYTFNISGTGTLNVTGNLNIGYDDGFLTSSPGNNNSFAFNTTLNKLNIQGSIYLNVFQGTTHHRGFVPTLNVNGGTLATTSIQSVLTNSTTYNAVLNANLTVGNSSGSPAATLQLTGANSLPSFSPYITNTITFNNPGATVEYSGGQSQTVYTDNAVANLSNTISYYSIKFSGTGLKTALSGNLNVAGDFTNTMANDACNCNAVSLSAPTVNFNGTTQNLYGGGGNGTTFYKVVFSNSGTKTMQNGAFNLASSGILTMSGSSTKLAAGTNLFTLLSDASGSAAIATIPSSCLISGIVNVQRFITGTTNGTGNLNYRCYRALCSPVNATGTSSSPNNVTSIAYLNQTSTIGATSYYGAATGGPGGPANGFTFAINNPTIYLYKETLPTSNVSYISGKYYGVTAINGTTLTVANQSTGTIVTSNTALPVGNGFLLFYIGSTQNRASGLTSILPSDATLAASGYLNQQNVTVNLWYGSTGLLSYTLGLTAAQGGPGYNFVGNPYACTLNLQSVLTDNYNSGYGVDNIYTLAPNGASQTFMAYSPNGASSPLAQGFAISGQGFLVHVNSAGRTLVFKESQKVAGQSISGVQMGKPKAETALTGLYLKLEKDSLRFDYCGIYFRGDWSARFEPGDAADVNGNIASLSSDGVHAAINHMPDYFKGSRMRLFVGGKSDGAYTIKIEGIRNVDTLYDIYLIDRYKKDSVNIRKTGAYAFSILKSDTASFGENRFVLDVRRNPAYVYRLLDFAAQRVGRSAHVLLTWRTHYEENSVNFTVERSNDGGKTFSIVGGMASTSAGAYGLTDKNAMDGQNIYRLKSEDINNNVTYSQMAVVMISGSGNADKIHLYPNPAHEQLQVMIDDTEGTTSYQIYICRSNGSLITVSNTSQRNWAQNIGRLLPDTYLVKVYNKEGKLIGTSKFLKN